MEPRSRRAMRLWWSRATTTSHPTASIRSTSWTVTRTRFAPGRARQATARSRLPRSESDETVVVEGNHYFPPDSIHQEYFLDSDTHTICPWKGEASYRTIEVAEIGER